MSDAELIKHLRDNSEEWFRDGTRGIALACNIAAERITALAAKCERLKQHLTNIERRASARPIHVCEVDAFDLQWIAREARAAFASGEPTDTKPKEG